MGIVLRGYYDIVLVFDTLWLVCICFGEALLHEKSPLWKFTWLCLSVFIELHCGIIFLYLSSLCNTFKKYSLFLIER